MKTTCKRMLSMLLVLMLVLSLIPSVSAATDEEAASSASDQTADDALGATQEDALEENPIQVMAADDYAVMAAASTSSGILLFDYADMWNPDAEAQETYAVLVSANDAMETSLSVDEQ